MKRTILALATVLVVFVAVFTVLVLRPLPKVKAHQGCTLATLKGSYGVVGSGHALDTGPGYWIPASLSAVFTFDGEGNVSGVNIYTIVAGNIIQSNQSFSNGTYFINTNCSVKICIPSLFGAPQVDIYGTVVDTGGDEFTGQLYSSLYNVTGTGEGERIAEGKRNNFF